METDDTMLTMNACNCQLSPVANLNDKYISQKNVFRIWMNCQFDRFVCNHTHISSGIEFAI